MKIDYRNASIKDLKCVSTVDKHRNKVTGIEVEGEVIKPTERFWTSVCSRFGFNPSVFKYFDHEEVFTRISEKQLVASSASPSSATTTASTGS